MSAYFFTTAGFMVTEAEDKVTGCARVVCCPFPGCGRFRGVQRCGPTSTPFCSIAKSPIRCPRWGVLRQEVWTWPPLIDAPDKFDTLVSCFYDNLAVVETAFVNLLEGVRYLPCRHNSTIDCASHTSLNLRLADIISSLKVSFRYDGMLDADVFEVHSNLVTYPSRRTGGSGTTSPH